MTRLLFVLPLNFLLILSRGEYVRNSSHEWRANIFAANSRKCVTRSSEVDLFSPESPNRASVSDVYLHFTIRQPNLLAERRTQKTRLEPRDLDVCFNGQGKTSNRAIATGKKKSEASRKSHESNVKVNNNKTR
jgi:hypothetical protein